MVYAFSNSFCFRALCAALFLSCSISQAAEKAKIMQVDDGDRATYSACLELRVPAADAEAVKLLVVNDSGASVYPTPAEPALSMDDDNFFLRRASANGAAETVYHVYSKTKTKAHALVFKIGNRRYPLVPKEIAFGDLKAQSSTSYGPLKDYTASTAVWSDAVKRRTLQATVRISAPKSKGTGTIIETPKELAPFLRGGEVLVVGAAHVTPSHLRADTVEIETFTYDSAWQPTVDRKWKGRIIVASPNDDPDVALLAFSPTGQTVSKAPLADSRRWFSVNSHYFCVGCPGGELPRFSFEKAVQASLQQRVVWIEKGSERGESGGGMFDQDGSLIAICARTYEESSDFTVGFGLLDSDEEDMKRKVLRPSIFTHAPSTLTAEACKRLIRENALRDFESALLALPEADQQRMRAEFSKALNARTK